MAARLIELIDLALSHPAAVVVLAAVAIAGIALLQRKPNIQRDADARLARIIHERPPIGPVHRLVSGRVSSRWPETA